MTGWKHYHSPSSVEEALALLAQYGGGARVIAGGTDLLLELMHGQRPPVEALVDVTRIPEMAGISRDGDTATVGGAVTHNQIVQSALMADRATCLVESCGVVGGPQVRNVGTLGGNVAHALPAGDGTTSLVALNADVEYIRDGVRQLSPILETFTGPGKSVINPTRDLLIRFRFKLAGPGEGTAFKRIMRPQGVALPVLGCAIWVRVTPDALIDAARVTVAPVAPTPVLLAETSALLVGRSVADQAGIDALVEEAAEAVVGEISPRTSKYRATAAYRIDMADVLIRRTLPLAIQRARTGEAVPEGVGLQ
jgi:carbon-monoxide dehydrogenase medium subunit